VEGEARRIYLDPKSGFGRRHGRVSGIQILLFERFLG
jgi:hypothetical protein